jgi:hypothetical protein
MTKDEALDLALEALEYWAVRDEFNKDTRDAITAIKQARSAPVQKPYRPLQDNGSQYFGDSWDTLPTQPAPAPASWMEMVTANLVREGVNKHKARELAEHFYGLSQPAPVQEPVNKEQ